MQAIVDQLSVGRFWPALALALMALTSMVRRGVLDPWLERVRHRLTVRLPVAEPGDDVVRWGLGHVRALVPVALASTAWLICVLAPWDVSATEAALELVLATISAMAGRDVARGIGAILRAVAARPLQR